MTGPDISFSPRGRALGVMALAAGLSLSAPARAGQPDPRPDLVILVLDAVRATHVGAYGARPSPTPQIDRLAREGILFQQAYAQSSWTKTAIASMFTGRYPHRHWAFVERGRYTRLSLDQTTMAEMLSKNGYQTVGISANANVVDHVGLAQGFKTFLTPSRIDRDTTAWVERNVVQQLKRADPDRPLLLYAHFLDPHDPHKANPGRFCKQRLAGQKSDNPDVKAGKSHVLSGEEGLGRRIYFGALPTPVKLSSDDINYLKALYDCELESVDQAVGRVREALRASGRLDRTLLVVTADHGEEFLDHGMMRHGYQVYQETVRVPLVIRPPWPLKRPLQVTTPVQHVDLLPTVLTLGGAPYDPEQFDGTPINALMPGTPPRQTAFGSTRFRGRNLAFLVRGQHKLIADLNAKKSWLFHLKRDPHEQRPLPARSPVAATLEQELQRILARTTPPPAPPSPRARKRKIDPKLKKQLRSLGYIQ